MIILIKKILERFHDKQTYIDHPPFPENFRFLPTYIRSKNDNSIVKIKYPMRMYLWMYFYEKPTGYFSKCLNSIYWRITLGKGWRTEMKRILMPLAYRRYQQEIAAESPNQVLRRELLYFYLIQSIPQQKQI